MEKIKKENVLKTIYNYLDKQILVYLYGIIDYCFVIITKTKMIKGICLTKEQWDYIKNNKNKLIKCLKINKILKMGIMFYIFLIKQIIYVIIII